MRSLVIAAALAVSGCGSNWADEARENRLEKAASDAAEAKAKADAIANRVSNLENQSE